MSLAVGTRLGPYEILAPLGAGGMGEVYRARDARLSREVAIKVLSARIAADPGSFARFEREARAVAALSHPHILAIHDFGRDGDSTYAVMELLEGETLAARLARGPLPPSEIARAGAQICSALEAAHRRGIVHRDLKPANIMWTRSGIKLLDFGLAKPAVEPASNLSSAGTAAADVTRDGAVVGTLAYMSPEQLEGRTADARSDIFALGATLYEMATGRKAFESSSPAGLISAILSGDPPPVSSVQATSPAALDRIVRGCLAKDPEARWQTAHDVGLQLSALTDSSPAAVSTPVPRFTARRSLLPWIVAAVCAAAAAAAFWRAASRPGPPRAGVVRFELPPPASLAFFTTFESRSLAVSPDGSRIAFVTAPHGATAARRGLSTPEPGSHGIWVRDLDSLTARRLDGTDEADSIVWSPDGRSLAFFTPGKLKRVDVDGRGGVVSIADVATGGSKAATWGSAGDILFTSVQGPAIFRVPASGGVPEEMVSVDAARGEVRLNWPLYLPDGRRFLYLARARDGSGSLMLAEPGKPARSVAPMRSVAQYVDPGYLMYVQEGALVAQRFDASAGRLTGEPIAVADQVSYFLSTGWAAFAASPAGTVVYQGHAEVSHPAWFDLSGRLLETIGVPGKYLSATLGRSGRRAYFERARPATGTFDVYSFDLARAAESPVTTDPDTEIAPVELSDGHSIVYSANRGGAPELYRRDLDTGREERLTNVERAFQVAQDVSPDGKTLVYLERRADSNFEIWTLALDGAAPPKPFLQSGDDKKDVRFSPDGRYLAFLSNRSGRGEVYVAPYPGPGETLRLSTGGARLLRWGPDGREIFYVDGEGRMTAIPVRTGPTFESGAARILFTIPGRPWSSFDLTRDGQRFLAVVPEITADEQPMSVIVRWADSRPR